MVRPQIPRVIRRFPGAVYYKPRGIPLRMLAEVVLGFDELEALRLADCEGLSHEEVGKRMNVSRSTAGRILESARRKVADALVTGKALRIEGGLAQPPPGYPMPWPPGPAGPMGPPGGGFGRGRGRGGGRGRMGGPSAAGPGGNCVCPQCGKVAPHQRGVPCSQMTCPACGAAMTRPSIGS